MKNTLAFIGMVVVVFLGLGLYLGWYSIRRQPAPEPGQSRLQIDINQQKIGADVKTGAEKVKTAIDNATKEPNGQTTSSSPTTTKTDATGPDAKNTNQKAGELIKDLIADGWFGASEKK